jgi:phosphoribosylaminoimidazolecarboxamide formyltransferase/IMP cyclohydrolase
MTELVPIKRALLSVSDKTGLLDFAKALAARGVELISTGGTHKLLAEAGLAVKEVANVTEFPEMLDGRVKTLHPAIHGGVLARRDLRSHTEAIAAHKIAPLDLVVVNLYPFENTVAAGAAFEDCIENIDIGGPALLRSAAKNHAFVAVVTDIEDYAAVLESMEAHDGATTLTLRRRLAATAYARTAAYDAAISTWFARQNGERFPRRFALAGRNVLSLRYGENPHQLAAFYTTGEARPGVATAKLLQGKALSYNNINDTDAAFELVAEFEEPAVAIIKHANPCGVATASSLSAAYDLALRCDPVSAFGGIIAVNRPLDKATAEKIAALFAEVVIAPAIDEDATAVFAAKKNLRVLVAGGMPAVAVSGLLLKQVAGGFLLQDRDNGQVGESALKVVTKRAPSAAELRDLLFAFRVAKHTKSNAIVYAKDGATVGIGAGQMSRVDSSRIAARKAEDAAEAAGLTETLTKGSVVASDAFFPFADGLIAAAEAGVTAIIQPGGSIRDAEVVEAADERGLAMVFTGMRHFRH